MAACDLGFGTTANVPAAVIIGFYYQQIKRYVRYVIVHKKNLKSFEEKMESLKARKRDVKQMVCAAEMNLETIYEDVNHWFQQVDDTINEGEEHVEDLVDQAKARCFIGLCPNIKSRYQHSRKAEEYVAVIDELIKQGQFEKVGFRDVLEAQISAAPKNLMDFDSVRWNQKKMADPASTAANFCANFIFQEIKRHVRFVIVHKKILKNFEEKMELLIARRQSVQQQVDVAKRNLETTLAEVQLWCERVDKTIDDEMKKVKDLEDKAKAKCFLGLCPNIKSRYQLSRTAEAYVAVVDQLRQQGQFNNIAVRDVSVASNIAASKNYEAFDSRKEVFDQIVKALEDPTISRIGVCGMGGMGKTTLVKEVAGQVEKANLFRPVVLVDVSPNPKIEKIQDHIASFLGLKYFEEKNISIRASLMSRRLEQEKNILIVLDDIWDELDLEEVGIRFGDQHKGCKILLTSRNQDVLKNKMDAKIFSIKDLEEAEAWDLFKKMAGNDFENSDLLTVATEVAKKCGGLPLAIVTVARALKNKDLPAWSDALRQLERPSSRNFISATVYSAIRLSYDNLEYEELKQTFLLCCLLVHNSHVEELLRFAMGLHLFEGVTTVEATRGKVQAMVRKLKDSCLLLDDYKNDSIAINGIVRDVARAIARDNHAFVLRDGDDLEDWEGLEKFKMICLSFATIKMLPHELECPQLTLLSMGMGTSQWNSYLEMPPGFFEKMKKMEVLNLIQADSLSSGSSISFPISLRTLCLKRCRLGDIVSLGKLKNLEILCLSESNIERLPEETRQLTKLRSLDLTGCGELKIIPPGVLSSLSRLEELFMGAVIVGWNQEGNARLYELKELSRLTTLEICILDAEIVKENLFEKLQRYQIVIGFPRGGYEKFENPRTVKLRVNTSIDHVDDGLKGLLKKTEALYLEDLKGVEIVLNQVSNRDWFLHLSHLQIRYAWEIQYIMNANDAVDKIAFRQLRSLTLVDLPKLISFCSKNRSGESTSVCQDELPLFGEEMELSFLENLYLSNINLVGRIWHSRSLTLKSLANLEIRNCDNLKDILSSSTVKILVQLNSFDISGCKRLREIIFSEDNGEDDRVAISFPQLRTLRLRQLEHFIGFCSENYNIIFSSLKTLEIYDCPELKEFIYRSTIEDNTVLSIQGLFDEKMVLSSLENLHLSNINVVGRIWHNQLTLKSLTKLEIQNCDNLKDILLSSSMAKSLVQLKSFEVSGCKRLREIIFSEDIEEDDKIAISFPQLRTLRLRHLEHFIGFCSENYNIKFPSLKTLEICACPKLKEFIYKYAIEDNTLPFVRALFDEKVAFPQLKELSLTNLKSCRKIWHDQLVGDSFFKLNDLSLWNCKGLRNVFPFNMSERLQNLIKFEVISCNLLEEIFAPQILDADELHAATPSIAEETATSFVFSRLRSLYFDRLPKLKSFYSKMHTTEWPSLKQMQLYGCDMVEIIFASEGLSFGELTNQQPLFWVKEVSFPQLEELRVANFKNCKKIWDDQLGVTATPSIMEEAATSFVFPKLSFLYFDGLPKLKRFYSKMHATKWPSLKQMQLCGCDTVEIIFASESLSFGELTNQQTLFWVNEDTFPNLEKLKLKRIPRMAWHGQLRANVFSKLRVLELEGCPDISTDFTNIFIQSLPNLEKLVVSDAAFSQIFNLEGFGSKEIDALALTSLNELSLAKLPQLTHLRKEECNLSRAFYNLRSLGVKGCGKLKTLLPPSMSFENLTTLEISYCHGIVNLIAYSTVKSLVQLTRMSISDCEMIEEIMAGKGDEVKDDIVFTRLKHLKLSYLPGLASFCLGEHNFDFPALENVSVIGCPKMETFSQGVLKTPKLQRVRFIGDDDEGCWGDNLNDTIQVMWRKRLDFMRLRNCHSLIHLNG